MFCPWAGGGSRVTEALLVTEFPKGSRAWSSCLAPLVWGHDWIQPGPHSKPSCRQVGANPVLMAGVLQHFHYPSEPHFTKHLTVPQYTLLTQYMSPQCPTNYTVHQQALCPRLSSTPTMPQHISAPHFIQNTPLSHHARTVPWYTML